MSIFVSSITLTVFFVTVIQATKLSLQSSGNDNNVHILPSGRAIIADSATVSGSNGGAVEVGVNGDALLQVDAYAKCTADQSGILILTGTAIVSGNAVMHAIEGAQISVDGTLLINSYASLQGNGSGTILEKSVLSIGYTGSVTNTNSGFQISNSECFTGSWSTLDLENGEIVMRESRLRVDDNAHVNVADAGFILINATVSVDQGPGLYVAGSSFQVTNASLQLADQAWFAVTNNGVSLNGDVILETGASLSIIPGVAFNVQTGGSLTISQYGRLTVNQANCIVRVPLVVPAYKTMAICDFGYENVSCGTGMGNACTISKNKESDPEH